MTAAIVILERVDPNAIGVDVDHATLFAAEAFDGTTQAFGSSGDGQMRAITPTTYSEIVHEMFVASTAGKNNYAIPVGCFVLDAPGQSKLEVDLGTGVFTPLMFGVDYTIFRRASPGTPATVNDAGIGFSFLGAVVAGWTFRFRWLDRRLHASPFSIAKQRIPNNFSIIWDSNTVDAPNGITVPELPGAQIEFWRHSHGPGGARGSTLVRLGRRYLPYYRGTLNQFSFAIDEFCPGTHSKRNRFRVCYYDPTSGARSSLSTDTIVVNKSTPDAVNGRSPVRTATSVWIE